MDAHQNADPDWFAIVAREGHTAWLKKGNLITWDLAKSLEMDTLIPLDSPGGKNLLAVAASLLKTFSGNVGLIRQALENCRKSGRWQGLSPYIIRKEIENEGSKLLGQQKRLSDFEKALAEDFDSLEPPEEMKSCPRCGKMIYPGREELPCLGH